MKFAMKRLFAALLIIAIAALPVFATPIDIVKASQSYIDTGRGLPGFHEQGYLDLRYIGADGKEKGRTVAFNALGNDGAQQMLDVYLRGGSTVTSFYLGLTDSTTPCSIAYSDTLATVVGYGEPSGNGYARQAITHDSTANGWPTLVSTSPGYQATSKTVTFTASGGSIGPVYCAFLTDVVSGTSGKHISFMALSTARTLANNESLQATYNLKIQ